MNKTTPALALLVALLGCEAPPAGPAPLVPSPAPSQPPVEAKSAPAPEKPEHITWTDAVAWRGWDAALREAKAENKSLCVVVYADWCPRCKELAPEFGKPELARAAKDLIMVRQDQDALAPEFAQLLGKYGDYVPRVLFVRPNGEVREDLQSGHPRYPYFYAPLVTDQLLANMHTASGY